MRCGVERVKICACRYVLTVQVMRQRRRRATFRYIVQKGRAHVHVFPSIITYFYLHPVKLPLNATPHHEPNFHKKNSIRGSQSETLFREYETGIEKTTERVW